MLPLKELNIYPKSEENLQSLLSYYFDKHDIPSHEGIQILKDKTSLTLNQLEFILRKLSEAYIPIFKKELFSPTIKGLLMYGFALTTDEEIKTSKKGILIFEEFKAFVLDSENNSKYL